MDGLISYAGVEDLTVDNMLSGNGNQESYGTVAMEAAQNCWLLRTEVKGSWRSIVKLYSAYRNTIRSSKFHESIPATPINGVQYGSGRGYGLHLAPWASANLLEDNIIYHLSSGIIFTSVVSGNVFSYNYITDLYYIDNTWEREAIFAHGMFPVMNLYEGNWTNGIIGADYYHGNSSYNTIFRNRHPGVLNPETGNPKTNIVWGLAIAKHSWYYNIIGNVLGEAGLYTQYELLNSNSYGIKAAYVLGYGGGDSNVKNTVLRHGNWDNVTNGVMWNGADDKSLPASLYRSSKPSWWGNQPWPPIGPDVPGYAASIPAKDRFLNVTPAKIPSAPFLH